MCNLQELNTNELISLYPKILKELKYRNVIRTNNLVGELGEYVVKETYSRTSNLPKLQNAPPSTRNIDAISVNGERYAIKSSSSNNTGVFHSIPLDDDGITYFEYLVVVCFTKDFEINLAGDEDATSLTEAELHQNVCRRRNKMKQQPTDDDGWPSLVDALVPDSRGLSTYTLVDQWITSENVDILRRARPNKYIVNQRDETGRIVDRPKFLWRFALTVFQ